MNIQIRSRSEMSILAYDYVRLFYEWLSKYFSSVNLANIFAGNMFDGEGDFNRKPPFNMTSFSDMNPQVTLLGPLCESTNLTLMRAIYIGILAQTRIATRPPVTNLLVVAEEWRSPLKFIVFIVSTSLNAREGTKYDNVQNKRRGETKGQNKLSKKRKQQTQQNQTKQQF